MIEDLYFLHTPVGKAQEYSKHESLCFAVIGSLMTNNLMTA